MISVKQTVPWLFLLLLTSCTTVVKYDSKSDAGPAKPDNYPIYVYPENTKVPRAHEVIGNIRVGDTPLTVMGGTIEGVLKKLRENARRKGADALLLTSVDAPGFTSPNYRADASLLRFTDTWESKSLTDDELRAYFRDNPTALDALEGIWQGSDPARSRVAVVKDRSKPGRDFIVFVLNSLNPTWRRGDKKMELAVGERPGVYRGDYFLDDYQGKKVVVILKPQENRFVVQLPNETLGLNFSRE